jgi:ankyrin repeat protein
MNILTANHPSLRHAAGQGDTDTVRKLLQAGAQVDEFDHAPMRRALQHRHAEIVRLLLAAGADISSQAEEFLCIAAKNGDAASLKALLNHMKHLIMPNAIDRAFYAAIASRNPAVVKILLAAGANPTAENNQPVLEAASAGSVEILRLLRRNGADLAAQKGQAIFNAVVQNHLSATEFLITSGADLSARLDISVAMAIGYGHAAILELLLNAGGKLANLSQIADAADTDSLETLLLLIHHGYDFIPFADHLVKAAAWRTAPRVLKYVLEHAPVTQSALETGLENCARHDHETVLNLLLNHGAKASANRSASLRIAIESRAFQSAQILLAAGANARDLDARLVVATIKAAQWPFLVAILQGGVSVATIMLTPSQAVEFFNHIKPSQFLRDTQGVLLSLSIRKERQRFAKITGTTAAKQSDLDAGKVAQWLTALLVELNSRD